jgi:hypothetical protein
MRITNERIFRFHWALVLALFAAGVMPILGQQQPAPGQSANPESLPKPAATPRAEPAAKSETPTHKATAADKRRRQLELEKEEREQAERERVRLLREHALYIADMMLESSDLTDKVEAASMKADFASLVCACGQRERAIAVARKSLSEVFTYVSQNQSGKGQAGPGTSPEAAILRVAEAATKCDPSSRKLIEADLSRARSAADQSSPEAAQADPPVVPDDLWGTKPSLARSSAASLLVDAALQQMAAGKQSEAESLLAQSVSYCVVTPFMVALTRISGDSLAAQSLFMQAERQVQALPSGQEMSTLDFGLPFVAGTSRYAGGIAQIVQNAGTLDPAALAAFGGELDAITSLLGSGGAPLVATSVDAIRMVQDKLPLYAQFRPDALPQVQSWLQQAIQGLPPNLQEIALRIPSAPQSATDQIATLQNVADNSQNDASKDSAYASMASSYIDSGKFDKASEVIFNISDDKLREEMEDSLGYSRVRSLLAKPGDYRQIGSAIERISSIGLRIKLYVHLAAAISKRDAEYAGECLRQAASLSAKLDPSPAQSHALLDIASAYADFDRITAMQALGYAVRSIDKHDAQPPSRWGTQYVATTAVKYDAKFSLGRTVVDDPDEYARKPYDLSVFRKVADMDFDGGLLAASFIDNKATMASAMYELCAGVLLKKNTPKDTPRRAPTVPPATNDAPPPSSGPGGDRK